MTEAVTRKMLLEARRRACLAGEPLTWVIGHDTFNQMMADSAILRSEFVYSGSLDIANMPIMGIQYWLESSHKLSIWHDNSRNPYRPSLRNRFDMEQIGRKTVEGYRRDLEQRKTAVEIVIIPDPEELK